MHLLLIQLSRLAYRVQRWRGRTTRDCCRAYLWFDGTGKRNIESKGGNGETWRQFYIRLYGFEPDWIKHSPSSHWDEMHNTPDIASIIKAEEEKYHQLRDRNERIVLNKFVNVEKLDGRTLAMLHHTYGCDPTMVEDILNVTLSERLHDDYRIAYLEHRKTGRVSV